MNRQRKTEIYWSYPKTLESVLDSEICLNGWGLYYISRKFGGNETLLYIGLTFDQTYIKRIAQHRKNWLHQYRGEIYIRFGEFTKPQQIAKDLVVDVESCLIYELEPRYNTCKKSSYSFSNEYVITSNGYRGLVPKQISTREQCLSY